MTAAATGAAVAEETYPDPRRAAWSVGLVLTASFLLFADVTIVSIAASAIQRTLGASVPEIEMTVAAYQIGFAATVITGGRLGDIYGRRVMFVAGFGAFAATSVACGLATSPIMLIACRALQGVAAAMLSPQVLPTVQIVLPPHKRNAIYAANGAILALASMTGPALAGLLISANLFNLGWRPIFLINLPFSLVAMILGSRLIPTMRSLTAKSLDVRGSLIIFVTLGVVMAALTLGQLYRWPFWAFLCLAAGPVLAWAFLRSQRAQEAAGRSPLLPSGLWRDQAFRVGALLYVVLFSGVGTFYVFYYILLQTGYHVPSWVAGLTTMSVGGGTIATSVVSNRLVKRWGGRKVLALGAGLAGLGFSSMLLPVIIVHGTTLATLTMPSQFLAGCGVGLVIAPLLSVVLAGIRSSEIGAAVGLLATAQIIGRSLGVGLTGQLFVLPLPAAIATATAAQLATGMSYSLLYAPVLFALSLVIISVGLPRRDASADLVPAHA